MSAISQYHALSTYSDERAMLENFREIADQVTLPQAEIAVLLQEHLTEYETVCHGEPYSELRARLLGDRK